MAQLIVRKLDPDLVARLRVRAASHNCSMEAEHREILRAALVPDQPKPSLFAWLAAMPAAVTDNDLVVQRGLARDVML